MKNTTMKSFKTVIALVAVAVGSLLPLKAGAAGQSAADKTYRYLWSHYTGWEPWQDISDSGHHEKVGRQVRRQDQCPSDQ